MRSRPSRSARSRRTHYFIAALIPALIVTLSITGFVWAQKQVTVVVDGRSSYMKTQASDVAGLLTQASINVGAGDVVTPAGDSQVADGMTIIVRHAASVTVRLGGDSIRLDVVGNTVADALVAAGLDPSSNPAVTPSLSAPLIDGMTISAPEVFARVSQAEVVVPFKTELRVDPTMRRGARRLLVDGQNGRALRLFRTLVTDGVEGEPIQTAAKIVAAPVTEVVAVGGTRLEGQAAVAGSTSPVRVMASAPKGGRSLRVEASGYAPGAGGADHRTATGAAAVRGVIAVDPKVIPMGTRVYVPGYGYAVAADTGGAIHGNTIDLCFGNNAQARVWGRQMVTIIILD